MLVPFRVVRGGIPIKNTKVEIKSDKFHEVKISDSLGFVSFKLDSQKFDIFHGNSKEIGRLFASGRISVSAKFEKDETPPYYLWLVDSNKREQFVKFYENKVTDLEKKFSVLNTDLKNKPKVEKFGTENKSKRKLVNNLKSITTNLLLDQSEKQKRIEKDTKLSKKDFTNFFDLSCVIGNDAKENLAFVKITKIVLLLTDFGFDIGAYFSGSMPKEKEPTEYLLFVIKSRIEELYKKFDSISKRKT